MLNLLLGLTLLLPGLPAHAGDAVPAVEGIPYAMSEGFPCDLRRFQRLPKLLLIGENHCDRGSKAVKEAAVRSAGEGTFFTGLEAAENHALYQNNAEAALEAYGLEADADSRVFGIESALPHGLIGTYFYAEGKGGGSWCEEPAWRRILLHFFTMVQDNPFLRYSWDKAYADAEGYAGSRLREVAGRIQAILQEPGYDPSAAAGSFSKKDSELFQELALSLNSAYVDLVNEKYLARLGLSEPAPKARDGITSIDIFYGKLAKVLIDIRDRDMAKAVEGLYCYAASEGKNVAAIVGAAHVPGIRAHLERDSAGLADLTAARSDRQHETILELFDRWAGRGRAAFAPLLPAYAAADCGPEITIP